MSVEQWAELLFPEVGGRGDSHVWGSVKAVNEDGSTRCSSTRPQ